MAIHFGNDMNDNEVWKVDMVDDYLLLVTNYLGWNSMDSFLEDCNFRHRHERYVGEWFMLEDQSITMVDAEDVVELEVPQTWMK